jgi:2-polyprenyl-3-methyl-5-hydroxy-6-metoxy-1,4-benzoquinol methylase
MDKNYLEEMVNSGYNPENIDAFHYIALSYLGQRFFPNKNSKILDVGAGSGHCLIPLKKAGWQNLWAIDIDDFNKDFFKKCDINFNQLDVEKDQLPYNNNFFDVILCFHLIEHLFSPSNFINEAHRILKTDGIFILVTPDWRKQYKSFYRDHTHIHPYDKESVARLLRCYKFEPIFTLSFGVFKGLGRMGLYKFIKQLMFTGIDLISISKKTQVQ